MTFSAFDQIIKERKQIAKLQLIFSTNILPNTSEGSILRELLFKDFGSIVENYGIVNAVGLVKQHMPELTDKLDKLLQCESKSA